MDQTLQTREGHLLAIIRRELVNISNDEARLPEYRAGLKETVIPGLDKIIQGLEALALTQLPLLSKAQQSAILCAHADLMGALECHESGIWERHDWEAHRETLKELQAAFPDLIAATIDEPE